MDLEINEMQTSVIIVFFSTLITSIIPPIIKELWSRRRDNNVFKVSDSKSTAKTCMRHGKQCTSSGSLVLQLFNFFTGGLLFGLLVLRLMPLTYRQFDLLYNTNNYYNNNTQNSVVNEDNVIVLNDSTEVPTEVPTSNKLNINKSLPYVELIFSGFFFVVYFIEQLIQAFTGWDGWQSKSSFVHLPAINASKAKTDKRSNAENMSDDKSECSEPSLVACHRKDFEDTEQITELKGEDSNGTAIQAQQRRHKPDCPLAKVHCNGIGEGDGTISRKLKIPSRPSHPSSIIIVLPTETSEVSTAWLQLKTGFTIISSVCIHQLTNGVTIALQDGHWCWIALVVILCHSILTAILITYKLMKDCFDNYIMFLCQLIFATLMPFGIIVATLIKSSGFSELMCLGLSNGATFHLVFMTLLQSERCTRLAGLIQYLSMYTGFTLVLCYTLLIRNK